jgi:hypothetical protein
MIGLFFVSDLSRNEKMYFLRTTPVRTIVNMKMPTNNLGMVGRLCGNGNESTA